MDDQKIQEYVNILRRTDVFFDLSDVQLQMVAAVCSEVKCKQGDLIFEENSTGDEMYVIAQGEVEIVVDPALVQVQPIPRPAGGGATIATLRSGQTFGEVALVDQGLRTASARCATRRALLLRNNYPELGYRVMRNLAADLAFKIRGTDLLIREQLLWRPRPVE